MLSLLIPLAIDFTSTTQTVTITAGTNSSMVNISVTDDNIVEGDETFSISLTVPSSLGPGIRTGAITSVTVTIIDTSGKYYHCYWLINYHSCVTDLFVEIRVRFVSRKYTGSEVSGFVSVTLELARGISAFPFNVTIIPSEQSPVSAEGNSIIMCGLKNVWLTGGVDFITTTLTATFASGMTMSNVSVPVIIDSIVEGPEEFDLTLSIPPSLSPAITAGGRDIATGVITDSTSKCVIKQSSLEKLLMCNGKNEAKRWNVIVSFL